VDKVLQMPDSQDLEVAVAAVEVENIHRTNLDKQETVVREAMVAAETEEMPDKKEKVVSLTGMVVPEMPEELDHLDQQVIVPEVQEILVLMVLGQEMDNLDLQVMQDH